jgi:protein N-terminal methyltransferase
MRRALEAFHLVDRHATNITLNEQTSAVVAKRFNFRAFHSPSPCAPPPPQTALSTTLYEVHPNRILPTPTMDINIDADALFPFTAPDALIDHAQSITYWNSVSADTNGMLGGYPQTSRIDLQGSSNFLTKLRRSKTQPTKQPLPPLKRVADCGAGVGRITKDFLLNVSSTVDVVEPVKKFTDELVQGLGSGEWAGDGDAGAKPGRGQVGKVINLGLQDWRPDAGVYDVIWNQWCLGHLTDAQLVDYFLRCKEGLVKEDAAWIVVKENMSTDARKQDIFDDEDSSVTRSDDKFRALFKEARLKIVATELQKGFPKELFPVRIYALKPE